MDALEIEIEMVLHSKHIYLDLLFIKKDLIVTKILKVSVSLYTSRADAQVRVYFVFLR